MIVRAGDLFEIRARYDNGGYPCLRITRVHGRHIYAIPAHLDGKPAWNHQELKFRPRLGDAKAILAKCWKRRADPTTEKP